MINQTESNFYTTQISGVDFTLLHSYTQTKAIGVGAQGFVIKAHDTVENRDVAIKKFKRPFTNFVSAKQTLREISILKAHNHPNLIKLINIYTPQSTLDSFNELYLVTEFGQNSLLNVIYRQENKLNHRQISFLLYQTLCGIYHLNQMNVIHRDLKPENITVNNDCVLKILDFGLSRQTDINMTPYTMTRQYRAPEILVGMPYSYNVDIWSVGCIFAELFRAYSKEKPAQREVLFHGTDHHDQWEKIVQLLGTPTNEFINRPAPNYRNWILSLPESKATPWDKILPDNCFPVQEPPSRYFSASTARNMIANMLKIDPEERYTVQNALQDIYVKCWWKDEEVNAQPKSKYDDSIEKNNSLDVEEWKVLIFDQVRGFGRTDNVILSV